MFDMFYMFDLTLKYEMNKTKNKQTNKQAKKK